jgi:hypothetical protein
MMNVFIAAVVVLLVSAAPGLADMVGQKNFVALTLIDFEGAPSSRPITLIANLYCSSSLGVRTWLLRWLLWWLVLQHQDRR